MSSPRLFSEKLKLLETANEQSLDRIDLLEQRLSECETKINRLIDEITPILTSHANALKDLMRILNGSALNVTTKIKEK